MLARVSFVRKSVVTQQPEPQVFCESRRLLFVKMKIMNNILKIAGFIISLLILLFAWKTNQFYMVWIAFAISVLAGFIPGAKK